MEIWKGLKRVTLPSISEWENQPPAADAVSTEVENKCRPYAEPESTVHQTAFKNFPTLLHRASPFDLSTPTCSERITNYHKLQEAVAAAPGVVLKLGPFGVCKICLRHLVPLGQSTEWVKVHQGAHLLLKCDKKWSPLSRSLKCTLYERLFACANLMQGT